MSNVSPPTLLLALHLDVVRVRDRRGHDPAMGSTAAGLARRRGGQRGSDDALSVAHPGDRSRHLRMHAVGLDAYDIDTPGFWGLLARAFVFAIVMAVAFWLLSPVEHRRLPWWDTPVRATGARSTIAGALVCVAGVALALLAKDGLSGIPGWTMLGCFLAAAAAARMSARVVSKTTCQRLV